jgi:hypothetical protein
MRKTERFRARFSRPIYSYRTGILRRHVGKLVVIDIDDLDARLFDDASLRVKIPNLRKPARSGVVATLNTIAPSDSW